MKLPTTVPSHAPITKGRRRPFLLGTVCLLLAGMAFAAGTYFGATGKVTRTYRSVAQKWAVLRSQNWSLLQKAATGVLAQPELMTINLKFKNYQKLVDQRNRAIAARIYVAEDEDDVPATLQWKDTTTPIRIRLKGDLSDHFEKEDKWSFRIKTRGDNTFWGMKQFSIHHPTARNYVYEWLYQKALAEEDIIALRYDFIRVTLNGRDLGVYALEEHFEKRLVEHNRRREGPIVRFSEDRLWEEWRHQKIPFPRARQNGSGSFLASEADAFQSTRWESSPEFRAIHDKAIGLLQSFQRGEAAASDVFDVEKMATYLAVTDLMGAEHASRWHNIRFYYNPITSRLEPIGFDGDAGKPISFLCIHMKDQHWSKNAWTSDPSYFARLFRDQQLEELYLAELHRVSRAAYLENLLSGLQEALDRNLRIVYSEDPAFEFVPDIFRRNQRYIRSVIEPVVPIAAHGRLISSQMLDLRLGNLQALPITVLGVRYDGNGDQLLDLPQAPLPLPGRSPTDLVDFATVGVKLGNGTISNRTTLAKLWVQYEIPGVHVPHEAPVAPWPNAAASDVGADIMRKPSNAAQFDFLDVDEAARVVRIKPGQWTISEDLILPPDYLVRCGPATQLHLTQGAMILSRSPLEFLGDEESPVVIDSPDATGQGFMVSNAKRSSTLEHVVFRSLRNPSREGWALTGAVTFNESPVRLTDCRFVDNQAEDSLNVVRTTFSLRDSTFTGGPSDALDADFCRGEIANSTFQQCGNDGIDVSGSQVHIAAVTLYQTGDKGISIGEQSQVEASDISIDQAKVGVAIKDASTLDAYRIIVRRSDIGLAVYCKKQEFGSASARLTNWQLVDVQYEHIVEENSSAMVNGQSLAPNASQVADQLESAADDTPPK